MARKKHDISNITALPSGLVAEAGRLIQRGEIVQQLPFWMEMKERDRETLQEEIKLLAAARVQHIAGGLAMGEHIKNIYDTCERYSGAFRRVMAEVGIEERNAYRYMDGYKNACLAFPEPVLRAAVALGLDIVSTSKNRPLGKYTEVVKLLPPPANPDPAEAARYVGQVKQTYKERRRAIAQGKIEPEVMEDEEEIQRDPEFLLKQNFRGVKNALTHVPKRQQKRWLERLFGMVLAQQGIGNPMTFSPEAVPEDFKQGPGRPRLETQHPTKGHEAAA